MGISKLGVWILDSIGPRIFEVVVILPDLQNGAKVHKPARVTQILQIFKIQEKINFPIKKNALS